MNKVYKPNFLITFVSNVLFCIFLLLIFSFLTFNYDLKLESLFSLSILLLTGIFSGFTTSKSASNKKLIFSAISSSIFLVFYIICSFLYNGEISLNQAYLLCCLNIYFGTFIGSTLSISSKTKRKGRK